MALTRVTQVRSRRTDGGPVGAVEPGRPAAQSVRTEAGLTLVGMAERIGLSQAYLSDCECGRRIPSLPALIALADAHRVLVAELLAHTFPFGTRRAPKVLAPPPDGRRRVR